MPTLAVNGASLFYTESGKPDGPAIVLSHSLFFDHRMFDALAEDLSDTFRVIRYDHRAHGQSSGADLEHLHMDVLADDAAALIRELGVEGCLFAGNSMGGFIALRLAVRHPDLVSAVAAIGSSAEVEGKLADFAPLVAAMQANGAAPVVDTLLYIMFGDTSLASDDRAPMVAEWKERMSKLTPMIGDAAHQVIHRESVLETLSGATVPVWAIAGSEDHAYEVPLSRNIADAAPAGRLEIVENAGHSVSLEAPERVASLLRELASVTV